MRILTVDTETDGFNDPHIIQLAAILTKDDNELASLNVLIKPDGWQVSEGAFNVHGISTGAATEFGIPIYAALWLFDELCGQADLVVAHNMSFDSRIIRGEYGRIEKVWEPKATRCTMLATTNICKLPGKRGYKWPSLAEAHRFFFSEDFDGAHDALVDVRACHKIHKHLIDNNLV